MQELFNRELNDQIPNYQTSDPKDFLERSYSELINRVFSYSLADLLVRQKERLEKCALEKYGSCQIRHQTTSLLTPPVQHMDTFPNLVGTSPLLPGKPNIPFKNSQNYALFVPPELNLMDYPDLIGLLYEFSSPEFKNYDCQQRIEQIFKSTQETFTSTYNKYKLLAPKKVALYVEDCTKHL